MRFRGSGATSRVEPAIPTRTNIIEERQRSIMCFEQFFRQFRVLAWKNALLKTRMWGTLILELVVPTIIIIALGGVKLAIPTITIAENFPSLFNPSSSLEDLYTLNTPLCDDQNLVYNCLGKSTCFSDPAKEFLLECQQRKIAVAPNYGSNQAAAAAALKFISFAKESSATAASRSTFEYFESDRDFTNYISSSKYSSDPSVSIYSSAIIFNSGYPNWDYDVRLNRTFVVGGNVNDSPDTSLPVNDISVTSPEDSTYLEAYLRLGVYTLMDTVNSYVASSTVCTNSVDKCDPADYVSIDTLGTASFPNVKTLSQGFWSAVGFIFALLLIISLLLPLSNVIKSLVQEKETKLREGMMMMALRGDVLWLSWLVHFMLLFLPLSIILTFAGRGLFEFSSPLYIFIYFLTFFISATSYAILISNFFSNSRTAAIVGCIVFFMGFFIYIGLMNSKPSRGSILAACLHPAAAFTFGTQAFIEYEDANIGVTNETWNVSNRYEVTFRDCVNMMFIDAIWMGVLSWYIASIWPSEFGTQRPFYFLCLPSYWKSCFSCFFPPQRPSGASDADVSDLKDDIDTEEVTDNLKRQVSEGTCVEIKDLYKIFDTTKGKKVAVDGLNLTMYSGQVTALLGHNGAGKSTAIGILTGLISPDGGTAIIEGRDILTDLPEIRKNLGVCPQHDILFPMLTVEEHLTMFAALKGVPRNELKAEVEKMVQSVGLTEKRKAMSKTLSGGQKRKLSVGIAFIGGSRIVFLDEPTSGMDPYSRRFTWNVIRQHREGRVVVLTTHFMDEADLLGDRIAIMGDGKLRCCGSSLYLKRAFGVGYNMTVEKKNATTFDSKAMMDVVTTCVPSATLLTNVGTELTFQLPLNSSANFRSLFEHIDNNEAALGVQSYGMSVTTLEEVFIKVAHSTKTQADAEAGRDAKGIIEAKAVVFDPESGEKIGAAPITDFGKIDENAHLMNFFKHLYALLHKRRLYFMRDTRSWIFQYVVPVIFVLVGMLVMRFTSYIKEQPSKALSPAMYNAGSSKFLPTLYSEGTYFCISNTSAIIVDSNPLQFQQLCKNITSGAQSALISLIGDSGATKYPAKGAVATNVEGMSRSILANRKDYAASQIGAYSFYDIQGSLKNPATVKSVKYIIHGNYSALHSGPLYASIMADTVIKSIDQTASVKVKLNPLPITFYEKAELSNFNVNLIVTFILLAVPYVPAAFATFIVREREVKAKHQQLVSGVSIPAYWLAAFLWDNMSYQLTVWLIVILVSVFPNTKSLSGPDTIGPTIGLLILFGFAISGFTYLLSFCFSTPSGAQVAVIFIVFILGLILSIVGFVLRQIPATSKAYMSVIRYIFAIFPPFAFGDGLNNLSLREIFSFRELKGGKLYDPLDWNITGMNLTFLAVEGVVYLLATILYEYLGQIPAFQGKAGVLPPDDNSLKDDDVLVEETRVASGAADDSSIIVRDFKKIYPGGKYAVKGISLAIPTGECFGLLGINGAGKSTALNMLSGEFRPSAGSAHLAGLDLLKDVHKCRRKIGFCPQFDALFELLTAREHLQLYARLKGINEVDIPRVVDQKVAEMGLTEYADRAAGTYSGGNKRKLSVAIAMIGEPSIVFLDEPSTGMDPVARRFMWEIISDIVTKREKCSLILTTHSMEECEALCTRIGIMVGGVLRCLGSSQRLRSKYGHGFQFEIGMVIPSAELVSEKSSEIFSALDRPVNIEPGTSEGDALITRCNLETLFTTLEKTQWSARVAPGCSAAELDASIIANGEVSIRQLASWWILEDCFDSICAFLGETFGGFVLRERQNSRIRVEITAVDNAGDRRRLAAMFGAVERNKDRLSIQEYSIAQTSLEQIFNQFAAQQEEETGSAAGISEGRPVSVRAEL